MNRFLHLALCLAAVALASCNAARNLPEPQVAPGATSGEHEVTLNGARQFYRIAGTARPGVPLVVFLHGGPGQGSQHFDALAGPYLEPQLRMVYYDQRGSGKSERPADRNYSLATLVEDVEALRRALGVDKLAVLGHSFGGLLALEYALKYPEHVSHLIFVSGVWNFPLQCRLRAERLAELRPEAYARVRGDTLDREGKRRSDCDLEFLALRGEERERYNTEAMFPNPHVALRIDSVNAARGVRNTGELGRALFGAGLLQYQVQSVATLRMPTLIIAGRHDGAVRPAGLRMLADRLPNARFVEFANSGHFVYLDEPERFAREVNLFVSSR